MVSRKHIEAFEQGRRDTYALLKVAIDIPDWTEVRESVYDKLPDTFKSVLKSADSPEFDWLWHRRRPTLLNVIAGKSRHTIESLFGTEERAEDGNALEGIPGRQVRQPPRVGGTPSALSPTQNGVVPYPTLSRRTQ